ncbi:MAG: hypothetical protein HQK79_18640 [Desulfobacterales bacterium]|nr:hypothetical protein [Desulfobacterales bacterium]
MEHHHHETEIDSNDKIITLLKHWIKHNEEHANSYKSWADRIHGRESEKIKELLYEAASLTIEVNDKFKKAIEIF